MLGLGLALFFFMLRTSGVSFPLVAGQSTDPFFFAGVFAVIVTCLLQAIITQIFRGIVQKRTALDIAKEVGKDLAVASVTVVVGAALDAAAGGDGRTGSRSSSGGGSQGGGGSFGGGGASGSF
ncbi:MAG: hypothetical protein BWK76_15645 [Desulfobulbaceae bacterium A2]|nr:MAG: hypothetical protein BWK76_15645 [Desulfobulbaceae bacterium A2]